MKSTPVCSLLLLTLFASLSPSALSLRAEAPGRYTTVNGLKMYYEVYGEISSSTDAPLVLIHGGGSTLQTSFGKILPLLSKTHQVVGVELQAHGHTPDRDAPSSFEQDADDIAALLKELHIQKADILGFSNGGNTAMQLAIRHPQSVRKLILASAFYKREGLPPQFWEFMKKADLSNMPQPLQDAYLSISGNTQSGLQAMHDRDAHRMQTFQDWPDSALASIRSPVLILIGDQDVVLPEHAVAMHRLIANSRLAILPATHGSYMGEIMSPSSDSKLPALFVAIIEGYLASSMPEAK